MARADRIQSYADARAMARRRLPWMVFDYIDGAAGEGTAETRNLEAMREIALQPRVLVNVSKRDIGMDVLGHAGKVPFGISPMGMCNLSGPNADLMLARIAARDQVPVGVSTVASTSLEKMIEVAEGHAWFQLYFSGDGSGTMKLVERAKEAGYRTLVMTLDVPEVGRRPRELRRGFKMPFRIGPAQFIDFALHPQWSIGSLLAGAPDLANFKKEGFSFDRTESRALADWDFLKRLRDMWDGNLVAKGVTDPRDAEALRDAGVDAIQVSTHGGRQLDSAPPPIVALAQIRQALGPDYPLFYDTGVRSGEDVVKAYMQGANFVFFGRAMQFAIAAAGEPGLKHFWRMIADDVSVSLAQMGRTNLPGR